MRNWRGARVQVWKGNVELLQIESCSALFVSRKSSVEAQFAEPVVREARLNKNEQLRIRNTWTNKLWRWLNTAFVDYICDTSTRKGDFVVLNRK